MTANIHNGDGGQYIAKIIERELAARGINPNFQPTLSMTAALEKVEEALSSKWDSQFGAMQAQLVSLQPMQSQFEAMQAQLVAFQPMQSQLSDLRAQLSAVESKVESLETPPPKPPRLFIHQVLLSMGYAVDSDACLAVGFQAYLLACERGKEPPKDAWGRVYFETDRELLEEAVRLVPTLKKLDR